MYKHIYFLFNTNQLRLGDDLVGIKQLGEQRGHPWRFSQDM
jgi:hypothetical protein